MVKVKELRTSAVRQRLVYFGLRRLNPFMKKLLRSPMHGLVSGNILLLSFAGRRSRRIYTTPVTYVRDGSTVVIATPRACRWWVNLRNEPLVTLLLAGQNLAGRAILVADDQAEKVARIRTLLVHVPRDAPYYPVALDADGAPDVADLERAAREHVVILVHLDPSAAPPDRPGVPHTAGGTG